MEKSKINKAADILYNCRINIKRIKQLPNDSTEPVLSAIRVDGVEWDIGFDKAVIKGKSVNNQYLIFDSNRKKILEDCHEYLCVVSISPTKKALDLLDDSSNGFFLMVEE